MNHFTQYLHEIPFEYNVFAVFSRGNNLRQFSRIKFGDSNVCLSVQGSGGHYSIPKRIVDVGNYQSMETAVIIDGKLFYNENIKTAEFYKKADDQDKKMLEAYFFDTSDNNVQAFVPCHMIQSLFELLVRIYGEASAVVE